MVYTLVVPLIIIPDIVIIPVAGLYVNPVSVSNPCVSVAPSTKTGYTISFVESFAVTFIIVAVPPPPPPPTILLIALASNSSKPINNDLSEGK